MRQFLSELKQRKVFKVASIYLVTAWGGALGASELLPHFGAPDWVIRAFVITLLLLFPVVVGLAWFYEITRDGIVRDPRDRTAPGPAALPTAQLRGARTLQSVSTAIPLGLEVVWEDQGVEKRRTFGGAFSAGRDSECEVTTLDPVASRRHARFEPVEGIWQVQDLGSSNGTLVDGERIQRAKLPLRCVVELGPGGQRLNLRVLNREAETMVLGSPAP